MATIKEIAALAGVSRGTVDRVLNNRGSVKPETEEKIKEIAKALDYKPNRAGLVLAAQKKKLKIGVLLPSPENIFFIDVEEGVREKAEELSGYNCTVLIKHFPYGVEAQLKAIDMLVSENVNGIALVPYNDVRIRDKINELFELGIPAVTLNTDLQESHRIAYVGSHYNKSGRTAAGLMNLMTHGPLHLGIITGSPNILCHTERIAGFTDALTQTGRNFTITAIVENHDDEFESYEKTIELLQNHTEINALFFAAGGVYGGCRAVTSLGLAGKIRIISFDNERPTKEQVENGVIAATICQQPKLQGSKPLDILFSYLTAGQMPEKEYFYVDVDIRIRENI